MSQDAVGRCSFIDVLEEAVLRRRPVAVKVSDDEIFIDEVSDVVTEAGEDYAVFRAHGRIPVTRIRAVTRAEAENVDLSYATD